MAMNQVQFQAGLPMVQFIQGYGTEAKCYRALYRARWPQGFRCLKCNGRLRSRFRPAGRVYYQCRDCRHQTTLTSGTVFEGRKLPLTTWYLAMHLLLFADLHQGGATLCMVTHDAGLATRAQRIVHMLDSCIQQAVVAALAPVCLFSM